MPDPQFTPVDHDPFTPAQFEPVDHDPFAVQSMTHWPGGIPPQPEPGAVIPGPADDRSLGDRARASGMPEFVARLLSPGPILPDVVAKKISDLLPGTHTQESVQQSADIASGLIGMARGPAGAMPDWLKEESLNQPGVRVRNYPSGAVRVDDGTPQKGIRPTGKVGVIRANPDDMTDFRRMIAEGRPFSEIGEYFGISKGAVAGIKRREELKSKVKLESVDHDPFDTDPLERQTITRGRSGRPIQTAPLPIGNENAVLEAGAKLNEPPPSITAFHGSPHDFDKFDLSRIGTGEGAQAYGHGLYFAENEGVAKNYRDSLNYMNKEINGKRFYGNESTAHSILSDAIDKGGNVDSAIKDAQAYLDQFSKGPDRSFAKAKTAQEALDQLKQWKETDAVSFNPGRMYQVSIKADPGHFLDWDKPLSEQGESGRIVYQMLQDKGSAATPNRTGDHAIATLRQLLGSDEKVSSSLRAAGIPGIKYLDQGSRLPAADLKAYEDAVSHMEEVLKRDPNNSLASAQLEYSRNQLRDLKEKGITRNFVVFDDKLIDIMKKYGLAGLSALPAAGAYHFRTQQVDHDPFASQ